MAELRRIAWTSREEASARLDREWLVGNGLGGYASGTIGGAPTRRYHGLLVAALPNPWGRTMMLDRLAETATLPDGPVVLLGPDRLPSDAHASAAKPEASALDEFRLELGLPVWLFRVGNLTVEKRLLLAYRQNTVYLRYRIVGPPDPSGNDTLRLALHPAMHFRPHDAPVSRPIDPYTLCLTGDRFEVSTAGPLPSLKMRVEGEQTTFRSFPAKHEAINYAMEAARGYEASGSLWTPGYFEVTLGPHTPVFLVASAESWETMNAIEPRRAWSYETDRRMRLLQAAGAQDDATLAELVLAADQFVIVPAGRVDDTTRARARGEDLRSIIAGYHWFTDWGRDTMISLEGLTLSTGRYREARYVLHTFAHYVRHGLLPNLFPEGSREGQYNTADATLWFFHAVDRYLQHTDDRETLRALLPVFEEIAHAHAEGTSFGIRVDPADGLLTQGQKDVALTWMDALCDGWVVTPRRGKAVEINALWFNAMTLLARWLRSEGGADAGRYQQMAELTRAGFHQAFWSDQRGYLADVVAPDGSVDESLRPNQLLAIALPNPVLDSAHWRAVVEKVAARLLTPYGLRSLDPRHPDFKPNYHGDLRTRDAAYHQGTVWSWLLGPFIDAWLKVHPDDREHAASLLRGLLDHLGQACIGQVSEIFDATPPFLPRGCVAQAWGVAELLRAWCLTRNPQPRGERHAIQ